MKQKWNLVGRAEQQQAGTAEAGQPVDYVARMRPSHKPMAARRARARVHAGLDLRKRGKREPALGGVVRLLGRQFGLLFLILGQRVVVGHA
jgi:hypothetical protein